MAGHPPDPGTTAPRPRPDSGGSTPAALTELADPIAEEHIIGALILSPAAIDGVLDVGLTAPDFYRGSHSVIYSAIIGMYADGVPVDVLTLVNRLEGSGSGVLRDVGGADRIREIATLVPAATNIRHWARIVMETAVRRRLASAGEQMQARAHDRAGDVPTLLAEAEGLVFQIGAQRRTQQTVMLREAMDDAFKRLEAAHAAGKAVTGLSTGFAPLDGLTTGLHPGNLIVVAARPSVGKTAFALSIATHAVQQNLPAAVFTLEMSDKELADRIVCAEGSIEGTRLRTGRLNADEWGRVAAVTARYRELPMIIEPDRTVTAVELRSRARRLKMRHPDLALIVVDYLQLMTSGTRTDSRTQDVSQTSRALKMLAGELNVPIIAVSQLSRQVEQRHDKRPMLSDLRESGQIEADADVVVFLYRDEVYNPEDADELGTAGVSEVIIAKQRNGPLGTVKLAFVKKFAKFTDIAVGSH